jgi:phage gp46-like protein
VSIYNRFQGDIAVKITPDGAKMRFINGEPVKDQGLENAVLISLFTKKEYWGNALITEESKKIGSDVETTALEPIVSIQSINNMTDAIDKALSWMTDTKLSQDNDVTVTNPSSNNLRATIKITPPGRDSQTLLFLKNGVNWICQAQNPASERLKNGI